MLWMLTALAAPIDDVQPVVNRAGQLRFANDAFADLSGVHAVHARLQRETDPRVRAGLADWLTRLTLMHGGDAELAALQQVALEGGREVRLPILDRLSHKPGLGAPFAVLVSDEDAAVRASALPFADAVVWQASLQDADAHVRSTALVQLRAHQIAFDAEPLLTDSDARVRRHAVRELGLRNPERLQALAASLSTDSDPAVRQIVRVATQ